MSRRPCTCEDCLPCELRAFRQRVIDRRRAGVERERTAERRARDAARAAIARAPLGPPRTTPEQLDAALERARAEVR